MAEHENEVPDCRQGRPARVAETSWSGGSLMLMFEVTTPSCRAETTRGIESRAEQNATMSILFVVFFIGALRGL